MVIFRDSGLSFDLQDLKVLLQDPEDATDHQQELEHPAVLLHYHVVEHDV